MKPFIQVLSAVSLLIFLGACKNEKSGTKFLPPSTGSVNSLMVVMETDLWKGDMGDKVRELFTQPALGLMPEQPVLSLTQIPPEVFKGAVTHSRAVLFVSQDSLDVAHIKSNVYARPQKIAVVKGQTYNSLVSGLESIAQNSIASFKTVELEEAQKRFTRSLNQEPDLKDEFGVSLTIPSAYTIGKHEKNFIWYDRQIPKGTLNIVAYALPEDSFARDSTFIQDIVAMRDSIGKAFIPGEYEGTHMITEKAFSPYVFPSEIDGMKAAEVRGIWEINGYPMAGPFISYIVNDTINQRKMVLEGFVFAPSTQKRDYIFELEAIIKTARFN